MNPELREARAELEADGLTVKPSGETSLWICATLLEAANGVRSSHDACVLLPQDGRWTALFPAAGMLSYEVPGGLSDLVRLIRDIYANYRHRGGTLMEAFERSVPDPGAYLGGVPPTADRPAQESAARHAEIGGPSRI